MIKKITSLVVVFMCVSATIGFSSEYEPKKEIKSKKLIASRNDFNRHMKEIDSFFETEMEKLDKRNRKAIKDLQRQTTQLKRNILNRFAFKKGGKNFLFLSNKKEDPQAQKAAGVDSGAEISSSDSDTENAPE